jgi:peptide/nickel transport system substrate-binding protein
MAVFEGRSREYGNEQHGRDYMRRLPILLTTALVAAACTGGAGNGISDRSPSSGSSLQGGTLRVIIPPQGLSTLSRVGLDPQTDWWNDSFELFRCCLLRTLLANPGLPSDEGGAELHPDLAAGMPEISRDGLTWTFRLKQGITYGPPLQHTSVVAADIIRALEREADLASPDTYAFYYSVIEGFDAAVKGEAESISGLEAPDDSTLVVHLTHPEGDLANLLAMPATAPIPPSPSNPSSPMGIAQGLDRYGRFLVSTGPYMIEGADDLDPELPAKERRPISGYVPGHSLTLVRNPSWERGTDRLRPAYLDRIEVTLGISIDEAVRRIRRGEADLYVYEAPAPQLPIALVQRFQDHPELGVQVKKGPRNTVRYITMNLAVSPLDDLDVRRAILYAIDKKELLDLRGGPIIGEVANHIVPDSLENGLLASWDPYPSSIEAAMAEMAKSKYDKDGDGRCDHPACRGLLMRSSLGYFPEMDELAARVRRDLERIGIKLRIETVTARRSYDDLLDPSAKVPLAIYPAWGQDFPNASTFMTPLFWSQSIGGRSGGTNLSLVGATSAQLRTWGYRVTSVQGIDDKIAECEALVGDIQVRCWAEADQLLMTEVVPWVPLVFEDKVQLVSDRVVAYSFDLFGTSPALDRIAVSDAA